MSIVPFSEPFAAPAAHVSPTSAPSLVRDHLVVVELRAGQVLSEPGEPLDHLYLPETAVVAEELDGRLPFAVVGRGGIIGGAAVLGAATARARAVVYVGGRSARVSAETLRWLHDESPAVRAWLGAHLRLDFLRLAHRSSCAGTHRVVARLADLLVALHESTTSASIPLTHEQLAAMLAVQRRATVTVAVGELRAAGTVALGRRGLKVLDPTALCRFACGCHHAARFAAAREAITARVRLATSSAALLA